MMLLSIFVGKPKAALKKLQDIEGAISPSLTLSVVEEYIRL